MAKEKRKLPRVRTDFGIKYKIKGSTAVFTKAVSVNISEGGMMIKVAKKLPPGSLLELGIVLPSPYITMKLQGQVVFVLDNYWGGHPAYRCGVTFKKIKKEDRQTIRKFVKKEMTRLDWDRWF